MSAKWFGHLPSPVSKPPGMTVNELHDRLANQSIGRDILVVDVRRGDIEVSTVFSPNRVPNSCSCVAILLGTQRSSDQNSCEYSVADFLPDSTGRILAAVKVGAREHSGR